MLKIKEIKVEKLFDIFDHQICLNDTGLTLLLGENGFGKTILLKMLNSIFNKNFDFIEQVIFTKFEIIFSDNTKWVIEKHKNDKMSLIKYYIDNNYDDESIIISKSNENIKKININYYSLDKKQIYEFKDGKWFLQTLEKINISIIETQRLLIKIYNDSEEYPLSSEFTEAVLDLSKNLVLDIQSTLAKSTELSQKLDRTYPLRLVEKSNFDDFDEELLEIELEKLEQKRIILQKVGLINQEESYNFKYNIDTEKFMKKVLMVYIEDSNKKLEVLDELSNKILVFKNIINKRFIYKHLSIAKEKGLVFTSKITGKEIPLSGLSSGEQHEIVLFFTLLFKIKPNTLILIDEPEISLHISWQNNFIEDLKEIIKLTNINILIATHSPNIIGNNWDITTELNGVDDSILIKSNEY